MSLKLVQELLDRRSENGRQVRGVMVGRLLTKAPWVFHYVDQFFYGQPCSTLSRYDVIMKYVEFCESMAKEGSKFCERGVSDGNDGDGNGDDDDDDGNDGDNDNGNDDECRNTVLFTE